MTVVVVNYRSESSTGMLLTDLERDQRVARIVVVDNGSGPASVKWIRQVAASLQVPVEVIENPENRGFAAAVNQGLRELATEFALVVNPDCRIPDPILPQLLEVMRREPRCGLLGCLIRNPDGSEQRGDRRYLPDAKRSLYRVLGLGHLGLIQGTPKGFDLAGAPLPEGPVPVEAISGAFMLVRHAALREVGGLDEGYFLHCEDLDWCRRFRDRGWTILFVPEVMIAHVQGLSSAGRPLFVLWHKHRGMWRYYRKFDGRKDPFPLQFLVWMGIVARLGILSLVLWVRRPRRSVGSPEHSGPRDR